MNSLNKLTGLQLSATRRVGISEFKGTTLINIREYYNDAAGDLKPGKKVSVF